MRLARRAKLLPRSMMATSTQQMRTEKKFTMVLITSTRNRAMKNELWIGLAEVVALPRCERLGGGKGAFVKVALWADSDSDFFAKVDKAVSELDLQLLELED